MAGATGHLWVSSPYPSSCCALRNLLEPLASLGLEQTERESCSRPWQLWTRSLPTQMSRWLPPVLKRRAEVCGRPGLILCLHPFPGEAPGVSVSPSLRQDPPQAFKDREVLAPCAQARPSPASLPKSRRLGLRGSPVCASVSRRRKWARLSHVLSSAAAARGRRDLRSHWRSCGPPHIWADVALFLGAGSGGWGFHRRLRQVQGRSR